MANVQVIEAYDPRADQKEAVAAYCRVSTDSEDQLNSYRTQIGYYTDLISQNPDWELADIYADEGITGTRADKRDEFQRMLKDCRAGKINRILVKSVSRFARNAKELIEITRELKELGVVIIFEEQDIDTSKAMGEMELGLYAMIAQQESESIARNIDWTYRKKMEDGTFITCCAAYGYRLVDNSLQPDPEEAQVVRRIYELYDSGLGRHEIASILNKEGIPSPKGTGWKQEVVRYILSNEKYVGDAMLQKWYTVNTLSHRRQRNRGVEPRYYAENTHEPIVDRDLFQRVQTLSQKRSQVKQKELHLFTHRIRCPQCDAYLRHTRAGEKSYWTCTKHPIHPRLEEERIKESFLNMLWKLKAHHEEILTPTVNALREIEYRQTGKSPKLYEINNAIAEINEKLLTLQKLFNKGYVEEPDYRSRTAKLEAQREAFTKQRRTELIGAHCSEILEQIDILRDEVASWEELPHAFDIALFHELIHEVQIGEDHTLIFRFHCGLELPEEAKK